MVNLSTENVTKLVEHFSGLKITKASFDEKEDYAAWETEHLFHEGTTFDSVLIELTRCNERRVVLTVTTIEGDMTDERNWEIIFPKRMKDLHFVSRFVPLEDIAPQDDLGDMDDKKQK